MSKQKSSTQHEKPVRRNPVARHAWQRGGPHGKSRKAQRRAGKVRQAKQHLENT